MRTRVTFVLLPFLSLLIFACSRPVIVVDPASQEIETGETVSSLERPEDALSETMPGVHVVQSGETLFSIAWQHQLNMPDLILWNDMNNPDLILVGQTLFLTPPGAMDATSAPEPPAATHSETDLATADQDEIAAPAFARPPPLPPTKIDTRWIWPVRGAIVAAYGATADTGDGIGIGGKIGADIQATANGEVAYAGSGLAAYGNLVIIRHDETFLSAYGHNDELLVVEGQKVAQGQMIARMGMGPQRIPQVHFELRRDGTPVNPLGYLPDTRARDVQ